MPDTNTMGLGYAIALLDELKLTGYKGVALEALKSAVLAQRSHNTGSLKLPTIEECYQAIPFPSDEREAAMFCAGIAECHKFVGRQLQASR